MKHQAISEQLVREIRGGAYAAGGRLPADREIAARFEVSYMTARRAVSALVEAELLERRVGDGTYVRGSSARRLAVETLNLICSSYEGSNMSAFLRAATAQCRERGWNAHVIRVQPDHQSGAVRVLNAGERALIMAEEEQFEGALGKAARNGRCVAVGTQLSARGISSVLADDRCAVELAIERLRAQGHTQIALLGSHLDHPNARVQVAAWREALGLGEAEARRLTIAVELPRFESAIAYAHQAMTSWLQSQRTRATALITLSDELAVGALAAFKDAGVEVPSEMSLINLNDSSLAAYAHPPLTCVDVNLGAHVTAALELLESQEQREGATSRLIEPHLIERQSVGAFSQTREAVTA